RLAELFGRLPSVRINPDEVVAYGAAIQAGSLSGKLTEGTGMATESAVATPRSGPARVTSAPVPIPGATDPGEDLAVPPRPLLLDVTPATLSIATAGGYVDRILDKNAPIPIERTKVFTTAHNDQQRVVIDCCRGESPRFADNESLGTLVLDELQPARRGEIAIEVTFRVDADGILHVHARDRTTGQEQSAHLNVLGAPSSADHATLELPSRQQS
ncbi:MAG: Hsp70 family protein, partial [Myxococcota bacterium]